MDRLTGNRDDAPMGEVAEVLPGMGGQLGLAMSAPYAIDRIR
jgi:hypothetical protein